MMEWAGELSWYSDCLRAGRSGDRIPVGVRFFAHVQTGPGAHPASCTMGTGSFPGVKRPGRGADHPPPSSAEVTKRYSYTSFYPLGQFRPVTGIILIVSGATTPRPLYIFMSWNGTALPVKDVM